MVQNIRGKPPKLASIYNLDNVENCEMKEHILGSLPGCGQCPTITMQFRGEIIGSLCWNMASMPLYLFNLDKRPDYCFLHLE